MIPLIKDIGEFIDTSLCGSVRWTAGGTGDNTAVTGTGIDCQGYGSAKILVPYTATLATATTLSLAVEYQESADNSSFDTAVALRADAVVATGAATETKTGLLTYDLDLTGKKRYIRVNFTPNLSAANTDVGAVMALIVKGGKFNVS